MAGRAATAHPYRAASVFLNVPFDARYEPCFLALIAGVAGLGLLPTSVLEVSASRNRLERIFSLLSSCQYSIHDLSRVEATGNRYPRFNMPFEAGLASALAMNASGHERFIFESRAHRVAKTCSDLGGIDVHIHGGAPSGVLRAVLNAFTRPRSSPSLADLKTLHAEVRDKAEALKREHRTLFAAHPFRQLAAFAVTRAADPQRERSAGS